LCGVFGGTTMIMPGSASTVFSPATKVAEPSWITKVSS
jgi:hypothetical protein